MESLKQLYEQRTQQFKRTAEALNAKYNRFSFVRLIIFLVAVGLSILLWKFHLLAGLAFTFLFLAGFYRFIQWHQNILHQKRINEALALINEQELAAQDHQYAEFPSGSNFLDPQHPYALDLDIFGPFSIFQFTNRCETFIGQKRLSQYLTTAASSPEITARQETIEELSTQLDWRQHLQAIGKATEDNGEHLKLLRYWLDAPFFVSNRRWLVLSLYLMPFWIAAGLLLWIFYIPWQAAILFLIPPAWMLRHTLEQVNKTHLQTTHAEKTLAFYAKLIAHVESHTFESKKLIKLQSTFLSQEKPASASIKDLSYIISQLNVRYNVFAVFLNIGGLWDLQWVYRLEKWKSREKTRLPKWFEALAEFEALTSVATLKFNHPDWVNPKIHDVPKVNATALGHPLILANKRVANDIDIPTQGHIKLITGSNMAGKSTFLRTVGLNIVLAMAGAPVCAKGFVLPRLQVYTSMRTQDALHESTSSFYAELKRLKFIIEAVESLQADPKPFFLLDEILKGTNSVDRHTGSKALIQQLIYSKGAGLIATHDLELGNLEAKADGAIENLCIEVEIKGGELFFDYKLKKGVSQSFNATLLMKNMGINISAEDMEHSK